MSEAPTVYPTPLEKVYGWVKKSPDFVFLRQPINGVYRELTWREVDSQMRRIASALRGMGLEPGDRVAILAKNCAEWFITDYAIQLAGLISVPLYPTQTADSVQYIMEHSQSKAIIVGKLDGARDMEPGIPESVIRIAMPYPVDMARIDHQWNDLLAANEPFAESPVHGMDELMTIIYTSGTTGNPKGVMHTYGSFSFGASNAVEVFGIGPQDRGLSFLPLSHIAERLMMFGTATYSGAAITFNESLATFQQNLLDTRPTLFFSVPRLWKKFQQGISTRMPDEKLDKLLRIPIVKGLVRKKIQKGLGLDQARLVISGAAPIAADLLAWYEKIGIMINEGYGMTENLAYGPSFNAPGAVRFGTVGSVTILPGSETRINENGEIVVRSPTLMAGYYLDPEKTAETIIDGWLHTGDRGEISSDGYLRITGRVKDVFKTEKGKFVQPNKIESLLAGSPLIEQVCVTGSGHSQPLALLELSETARAMLPAGKAELEKQLLALANAVNKQIEHHEILDRLFIVSRPWTPENGMLTPTLKIKRASVEEVYNNLLEKYRDSKVLVVWEADEA
jgi:long-chain acyl-CoA synthetase